MHNHEDTPILSSSRLCLEDQTTLQHLAFAKESSDEENQVGLSLLQNKRKSDDHYLHAQFAS